VRGGDVVVDVVNVLIVREIKGMNSQCCIGENC
jgi:hypothetical protein